MAGAMTTRVTLRGRPRRIACAVWAVTASLLIAATILGILDPNAASPANPSPDGPRPGDTAASGQLVFGLLAVVVCFAFASSGAVMAARRPRNAVGWLFCCTGLFLSLTLLVDVLYWHLAFGREVAPSSAKWFAWVEAWSWIPAVVPLFGLVPLLFPTGAPPSPRWRVVGWTSAGAGIALLLATALTPGGVEGFPWVENPLGLEGLGLGAVAQVAFGVWLVASLAAVVSLVVRYRRSRGIERQQLRWVTAAGCLLLLSFAASGALTSAWSEQAGWACLLVGLSGFAVGVAIALLRYRLYDLDVVVNRALVYGVLTATLAAAYLGSVLLLQIVVSPSSDLAVAASTLAVAALFRPVRTRVQGLVDRRFYRRRYDAQRTLDSFTSRLREHVELEALSNELRGVVEDTVQPEHVSLWLRAQ
jgi:hypothetical protein